MKEPRHSCPMIDNARKQLKSLLQDIDSEFDKFHDALEELRDHNQELREWGGYWELKASELENELKETSNASS